MTVRGLQNPVLSKISDPPYSHRDVKGSRLPQWQYEVTGGGRVWYVANEANRTVWTVFAGRDIPK